MFCSVRHLYSKPGSHLLRALADLASNSSIHISIRNDIYEDVLETVKRVNLLVNATVLLFCIHWQKSWTLGDRHVFKHLVFLILSQINPSHSICSLYRLSCFP